MLGDSPGCVGFGVGSVVKKYGFRFPFSKTSSILQSCDILFGNLEAVLSDYKKNWWLPTRYMRGDPGAVNALKTCGYNVLSVANNHMMQHGTDSFYDTISNLKKAEISVAGIAGKNGFHSIPAIIETKGVTLGFLGYSLRPEEYRPDLVRYATGELVNIIEDIHELKKIADIVILSLHWGDEYMQKPSPNQINMARLLINEGAGIILGHHPHVLQGIEKYSKGIIAYSLGNFIFNMRGLNTEKSIILEIYLSKEGVSDFKVIPLRINDLYQPEVLHGIEEKEFMREFKKLCEYLDENYGEKEYNEELKECFTGFRKKVLQHYRDNIFRFSFFDLSQIVFLIIIRRILKKHI